MSHYLVIQKLHSLWPNPAEGGPVENTAGLCTVTRRMIRERAVARALGRGRSAAETSKADWEQAKQELLGIPDDSRFEIVIRNRNPAREFVLKLRAVSEETERGESALPREG